MACFCNAGYVDLRACSVVCTINTHEIRKRAATDAGGEVEEEICRACDPGALY